MAEAMILHAIVFLTAPKLDKRISGQVFSFRLVSDWEKKASKGEEDVPGGDT